MRKCAVVGLWLTLGCGQSVGGEPTQEASAGVGGMGASAGGKANQGGTASSGGSGSAQGGAGDEPQGGAESGASGAAGSSPTVCVGSEVPVSKRLVRLSFSQISRTIRALLGDSFGDEMDQKYLIGTHAVGTRPFPPLAGVTEGSVIDSRIWQDCSQLAADAGTYAQTNIDALTGCGDSPSDACARASVGSFAARVFRRPAKPDELASFLQVYDEVLTLPASNAEALGATVEALLQSPQFLYRTEFGDDASQPGALKPFELASELSYFLTDGPPDAELLDAAANGALSSAADVAAHTTRILQGEVARGNFEQALLSYFRVEDLLTVVIDDPAYTPALREAAFLEIQWLFENTLWTRPFTDLLTSPRGAVNTTLAEVYGVSLPAMPGESTFVELDLPRERTGVLTRTGLLAGISRPDGPSVVARGLMVDARLLCATLPPLPDDLSTQVAGPGPLDGSQRQLADFRANETACRDCHTLFDAYGLALDTYDAIGRYRTLDPQGRPIDPRVTLPPVLNDAPVADAVEMQAQIAKSPAFARCISKTMLLWALAEGTPSIQTENCPVHRLADAFTASGASFSSLLREIAVSPTFRERAP